MKFATIIKCAQCGCETVCANGNIFQNYQAVVPTGWVYQPLRVGEKPTALCPVHAPDFLDKPCLPPSGTNDPFNPNYLTESDL